MKFANLVPLLFLSLTMPILADAQKPTEPAGAESGAALQSSFDAALAAVLKAQSDDLYPVADAVLNAGGTETDFYRLMKAASDAGQPVAQRWNAQLMLLSAQEPGMNPAETEIARQSRELMQKAAESGYVPAQVEMARYAGSGIGAPANESEGMRYLMSACKAGSSRARAAYLLLSGRLDAGRFDAPEIASELRKNNYHLEDIIASLPVTKADAEKWLRKAAEHGSATAPYVLAQNENASAEAFVAGMKLAAERHLPEGLATYGQILLNPLREFKVEKNEPAGIRHLQLAFMLGYSPVTATLATLMMNRPEEYSAARVFDLYNVGTVMQDARASVAYAYCLACGRGCDALPDKGVRMLEELADAGSAYSYVALADLYFNGAGVPADLSKAVNYLGDAAASGVPNTYSIMAALTHLGNASAKPDARRAELYLRMAEERGETEARRVFDALVKEKQWHFLLPVKQ